MSATKSEQAFSWSGLGLAFEASRCDFTDGVIVRIPERYADDKQKQFRAFAAMIAYHRACIVPDLNGFIGYANVQYRFVIE